MQAIEQIDNERQAERCGYRGRLAPTPSGWLHDGHAATFRLAGERCRAARGTLILRIEDIDPARCRGEYAAGAVTDLRALGLRWHEGPDCGGPCGPYQQSGRFGYYRGILRHLWAKGLVYPCPHSRAQIRQLAQQLSPIDGEMIFPAALRNSADAAMPFASASEARAGAGAGVATGPVAWRFRVPDGQWIEFTDAICGRQSFLAGTDFGDFVVWRKEDLPAYELAVVTDDYLMGITEVVRGQDLLLSTARQLLIYAAMGWEPPQWCHAPLVRDPHTGERMAKSRGSPRLSAKSNVKL